LKHRPSSSISAKSDKRKDSESAAPASSARDSDESGSKRARSEVPPSGDSILDVNINHLMSSIAMQTNKLKENLHNLQNVRQESRLMSASQSLLSSNLLDKLHHRSATPNEISL
jgi:hypothetical protein